METVQQVAKDTVRKVNLPEGAVLAFSEPISPVMITRLRTVGADRQTIECQLEQMYEPPIGTQGGLLALTMEGHAAFNTTIRKRITWLNFSTVKLIGMGLIRKWEDVGDSQIDTPEGPVMGAKLVNIRLEIKDARGNVLPCKIVETDSFTPRPGWIDRNTGQPREQRPKTAGLDGDLLTFTGTDGKANPIYSNRALHVPGMDGGIPGRTWDEDVIIKHNNTIVGSSVRAAMGAANIAVPKVPGSPASSGADPNLQNKGVGQTGNLLHKRNEPVRTGPEGQQTAVSEKTKAEQSREQGTRSPEEQPQP